MFRSLITWSVQRPAIVLVLSALLLVLAISQLARMPVDVFPELNAPTVVTLTEAQGLAADEVEQNITFPLESAMSGLPGIRRIRSSSAIGLSIIWVEFDWGEDIYRARTLVAEKLASVRSSLPAEAHAEITPITSITGEILLLSLTSPDGSRSPMELRSFAEFELRNQLLAVPGVAQVVAIGGELPEYQVRVRQDRLLLHGLSIAEVVDAARAAHSTAGAGYLPDVHGLELPVRQTGRVRSVADIERTIVRYRLGHSITIGDVATVLKGPAQKRGTGSENGHPAVVLSVQKSPGTNTLQLTSDIDRAIDQASMSMQKGIAINRHAMRQADFIENSVRNLLTVLRDAALLIFVIVVLFLLDVRTTFITLVALPLSLAVALLSLHALGLTINVMTLGGLAVAIGGLVDDAIIDVENVVRRLRSNSRLAESERPDLPTTVLAASNEIRQPMVFATLVIVLVCVPLLFLQGLEGRFFRPLGVAYIVSTLASLLVALTVTPAMCRCMLGHMSRAHHRGDSFVVRALSAAYAPMLRWSLRHKKPLLLAGALLTAGSIALGSTFGRSFLPPFHEGSLTVFVMAPPGTSLNESDRLALGIEQRLARIPGVRAVVRRTGRAERDEHAEPASSSELDVSLLPSQNQQRVRRDIDAVLAGVPMVTTSVGQPIEHRLSHMMSGTPAEIAIVIQGDDLSVLRKLAKQIEAELQSIPGTRDVVANREVLVTSLPVRYRHEDLAACGLTPALAAEQVQMALMGTTVATISEGVQRYALSVRLHEDECQSSEDLGNLHLRTLSGGTVRLRDVADLGIERTSNLITRENGRRKAVISCNTADGFNLGQLVTAVRARIEPMAQKVLCTVQFGGQFEAQQSASHTILWLSSFALGGMLLLIQMALGSFRAAAVVMLNLPLALIGGIGAIYLTESPALFSNTLALFGLGSARYQAPVISIASMIGFITLFGIAVRNGILLVRYYLDLLQQGVPLEQAVVRGAMERMVPILMTALTAALGLLPLVLAAGEPGSELLAPLSIVVLFGLLSSTLLNLLLAPAGFLLIYQSRVTATHTATHPIELP